MEELTSIQKRLLQACFEDFTGVRPDDTEIQKIINDKSTNNRLGIQAAIEFEFDFIAEYEYLNRIHRFELIKLSKDMKLSSLLISKLEKDYYYLHVK